MVNYGKVGKLPEKGEDGGVEEAAGETGGEPYW